MQKVEIIELRLDEEHRAHWWAGNISKCLQHPPMDMEAVVYFEYERPEPSLGLNEGIGIIKIDSKQMGVIKNEDLPHWLLRDIESQLWKKIKGEQPC